MKQQINLYQPIFRRQKKIFSAAAMLQVCAFFLVVFMGIYVYGQAKLQPLQNQLDTLNRDLVTLNSQLSNLERQQGQPSGSRLLENETRRLEAELAKRLQVQKLLMSADDGNTRGFSGYLEAFARQHVQGTWLTRFSIAAGGTELGLEGKTLTSELVPVFIDRLSDESLLTGMSFNVMELTRPAQPAGHFNFMIRTR